MLDVHKVFTFGVIKDEKGVVLNKAKFNNSEENFETFFNDFPPEEKETKAVIESTGIWEYIYEILDGKGYEVNLANPCRTKAIASAKISSDAIDAATLADLLRANLIAESYIPPKEVRRLRDVVRHRKTLVKGRTISKKQDPCHTNKARNKLSYKSLCPSAINWLNDNIDVNDVLVSYFNMLEQYDNELKFIEKHMKDMSEKDKQARLLKKPQV